jgi:hypothetical protein
MMTLTRAATATPPPTMRLKAIRPAALVEVLLDELAAALVVPVAANAEVNAEVVVATPEDAVDPDADEVAVADEEALVRPEEPEEEAEADEEARADEEEGEAEEKALDDDEAAAVLLITTSRSGVTDGVGWSVVV